MKETLRNSAVVFVASDELVDIPHPTLPNIVHIGGLGLTDSKQSLDTVNVESEITLSGLLG